MKRSINDKLLYRRGKYFVQNFHRGSFHLTNRSRHNNYTLFSEVCLINYVSYSMSHKVCLINYVSKSMSHKVCLINYFLLNILWQESRIFWNFFYAKNYRKILEKPWKPIHCLFFRDQICKIFRELKGLSSREYFENHSLKFRF